MKIALVTGASSGLGREFVRQIAEQGKVEEIWAIARRRDRLEALQSISAVPIRVLALDLTRPGDMEYLRNTLQDELPDIRILVNAAGMGRMGPTVDIPAKDNDAMIDLNCRAAVDVTDAAFPYLHPGSQVLEICSTAGFQPIPGLNVYAATKAFLLSYTQTLHYELSPAGIHVTAVCPYWVKDTEFIGIAEKGGHGFRHYPLGDAGQPQPGCCAPRPAGQRAEPARQHTGAGVHAAPRRGKSYPQPALPAAGRLAEPRLTQPYNTEESIMEKHQYICPKCGCQQYESDRLQATGGNFAKMFDIQNKKFVTISCCNCGYTELYRQTGGEGWDLLDFLSGH